MCIEDEIANDCLTFTIKDGPSVAIVDYIGNPNKDIKRQWIKVWDNYWWARGVADSVNYEADEVIDFQIGFGANPNVRVDSHHLSFAQSYRQSHLISLSRFVYSIIVFSTLLTYDILILHTTTLW
jgi:hypothetical protein